MFRGRTAAGLHDGYYYLFVYANSTFGGQKIGSCLFRSRDPSQVDGWRSWDGNAVLPKFAQTSKNPYASANPVCAVVNSGAGGEFRSVQWHAPSQHYIGIGLNQDGVWAKTSRDLLTWSNLTTILPVPAPAPNQPKAAMYPSLIDHGVNDDEDAVFDTVYDVGATYLYYRKEVQASGYTRIVRRRLHVENY